MKVEPISVIYEIDYPKSVKCVIETEKGIGIGLSICSTSEESFDFIKGRIHALGRAKKALCKRMSSCIIRASYGEFPSGWKKRQIDRVLEHCWYTHKSEFIPA